MTIIRSEFVGNFTTVDNAVFSSGLSLDATGLLCYLIGRPPNWRVLPAQLCKQFSCGRDKMYGLLAELKDAKYIRLDKFKDGRVEYTVFPHPTPIPEKPEQASLPLPLKPDQEKPDQEKPHVLIKKERPPNQDRDETLISLFDQFWANYPHKPGNPKKPALEKFINLTTKGCQCKLCKGKKVQAAAIVMGAARYAKSVAGKDPQYIKMATTFLNQHCWTLDFGVGNSDAPRSFSDIADSMRGGNVERSHRNGNGQFEADGPYLDLTAERGSDG